MEQGMAKGHPEKVLEKIWGDWTEFAKYAFNKSHATCYSWVAYQTAYLKANYPAEYMAAVLSRNLNNTDKFAKYMDECRAMKLVVKGPDVNESLEKFSVFKSGEIRFGLGAIKGLGGNTVAAIISERQKNGAFKDLYDLVERVNLGACNKSAIELLAMAGAFDCFGIDREILKATTGNTTFSDVLVKYGQMFQSDKQANQGSLFDDFEPIATAKPVYPQYEKWSTIKLLEEEKKLVSMYLSAHPLDDYYMELTYGCDTACADISSKNKDGEQISFGGLVTGFVTKTSAKGMPYGIIELEDFSGKGELRLFGQNYQNFKDYAIPGTAILVKATVAESRFKPGMFDVRINKIEYLSDMRGKIANAITIEVRFSPKSIQLALEEALKEPDEHRYGSLYLKVLNQTSTGYINMKSRKKIPITRTLVRDLEESEITFKITNE
jgi:DNA polymerase-3 subunit alpha